MLYLKRLSDNVKVKATIKEIKYSKSEFKNWLFDWSKTEKKGYKILPYMLKMTIEFKELYL